LLVCWPGQCDICFVRLRRYAGDLSYYADCRYRAARVSVTTFFFVTGQIYTDSNLAGEQYKSAAQGYDPLATYGVGMLIGFLIVGPDCGYQTTIHGPAGHDWMHDLADTGFHRRSCIPFIPAMSFRDKNHMVRQNPSLDLSEQKHARRITKILTSNGKTGSSAIKSMTRGHGSNRRVAAYVWLHLPAET
jgi:hypothetical protein